VKGTIGLRVQKELGVRKYGCTRTGAAGRQYPVTLCS
jgi:hypothetical protein